ncbi:MAG: hypothetical protein AAF636_08560 [Pseudomonadota bacterium]
MTLVAQFELSTLKIFQLHGLLRKAFNTVATTEKDSASYNAAISNIAILQRAISRRSALPF